MSKVTPLTPSDLNKLAQDYLPEFVVLGINNAIKNNFKGKASFTITQDSLIKEILAVSPESISKNDIFDNNYLDFEPQFRKHGWIIQYERPDRDENFDAYFNFKSK